MATSSPFGLLKLPLVPLDEILKAMSLQELVPLAVVSNKTKQLVKSFVRNKSYTLVIFLNYGHFYLDLVRTNGEKLRLTIELLHNWPDSQMVLSKGEDIFMTAGSEPEEHIASYWKDRIERFGFLLSILHTVFNPTTLLNVYSYKEHMVSGALDVIKKSGITLDKAKMDLAGKYDEIFQKFLELSSKKLKLKNWPTDYIFNYKSSDVPMKFESLSIHDARWAKLDYFVNCKSVILLRTELKIEDLIKFLKKWKESEYPLEFLNVHMKNTDTFDSIGRELSLTSIKNANTRQHGFKEFNDGDCFGIQRTDGKKAIIYRHFFTIYNHVSGAFDGVASSVYFETIL